MAGEHNQVDFLLSRTHVGQHVYSLSVAPWGVIRPLRARFCSLFSSNLLELEKLDKDLRSLPYDVYKSRHSKRTILSAYISLLDRYDNTFERSIYREIPGHSGEVEDIHEFTHRGYKKWKYLSKFKPRILAAPIRRRMGSYDWSCLIGKGLSLASKIPWLY